MTHRVTLPAKPADQRLPSVQGLRALAVVLVIVYHSGLPIPGGYIGVDVFFVISGFVICRLLIHDLRKSGKLSFGRFYRRRIRRLLPALSVMTVFVLVGSMLIESPIQTQSETALTAATATMWLANIGLYYVTSGYFAEGVNPSLLHTWSLAVEEQFYLVFPVVIALTWAIAGLLRLRRVRMGVLAGVVVVCSLVSFAINYWLCYQAPNTIPAPVGVAFFFPFGRAWEFGVGALVALWAFRERRPSERTALLQAAVGLLVVLGSAMVLTESTLFPGLAVLAPVLGTGLLLLGLTRTDNAVSAFFATPPLTRVGDLSYSLYLWHWPLISFGITLFGRSVLVTVLAALISIPLAVLSFRLVEDPIRSNRKFVWGTPRLILPCVGVPLALALVLGYAANQHWGSSKIADIAAQVDPKSEAAGHGCQSLEKVSQRDMEPCTTQGDGRAPVLLMGDSNAGQYADGLVKAAEETGRTVTVAAFAGCSLNLVDVELGGQSAGCLELAEDAVDWATKQKGATVLVASANEFVDDDEFTLFDPETDERSSGEADKRRIWERGLVRTYERLQGAGLDVVQIGVIPHFRKPVLWRPADCNNLTLRFGIGTCGETMSLAEGNRQHGSGLAAEEGAARTTGVATLDLRPSVCPEGECRTNRGDFWVYREGMHLSLGMSLRLAKDFIPVLERSAATS